MPDDTDDELARLQARAYGPAADIDAEGLARLAALQESRTAAVPTAGLTADAASATDALAALFGPLSGPAGAASDVAAPTRRGLRAGLREEDLAPAPEPGLVFEPLPDAASEAAEEEPAAPARSSSATRIAAWLPSGRMRWVWLASLVVAIVVTALVTAWLRPSDGAGRAATLTLRTDTATGDRMRGSMSMEDGVRYFGEYLGLHIYSVDSCLEASVGDARRPVWRTCASEELTPIMDVYFSGANDEGGLPVPDAVSERFPEGAVIRFTLRGDTVLVDEGPLPSRG